MKLTHVISSDVPAMSDMAVSVHEGMLWCFGFPIWRLREPGDYITHYETDNRSLVIYLRRAIDSTDPYRVVVDLDAVGIKDEAVTKVELLTLEEQRVLDVLQQRLSTLPRQGSQQLVA